MKNELLETYSIGLKLRALRQEKRVTLARLAIETGLSTALLSKLETDRMLPTLPTLARICKAYGIGLGYFFYDPTEHSVAITRKAHLSNRGRPSPRLNWVPLHVPAPEGVMAVSMIEFPPGAISRIGEQGQRNEIMAYVIEGKLQLDFAGSKEILETGDCVVLSTSASGVWSAVGDHACRALTVSIKRQPSG